MSTTPRTDAQAVSHIGYYTCETVPAILARKLETELASAQLELGATKAELETCKKDLITMIERDAGADL